MSEQNQVLGLYPWRVYLCAGLTCPRGIRATLAPDRYSGNQALLEFAISRQLEVGRSSDVWVQSRCPALPMRRGHLRYW